MNEYMGLEVCDTDLAVDQLVRDYDNTVIPLPDIESEPHLLISKVRKHYMEYLIKQLSVNYETNQRLPNKNIYIPSAIWRCAKNIEMKAAQMCMVVQLYRKNIVGEINGLKKDTKKGKLYKKLYDCLHTPPKNEKKTQTTIYKSSDCNCQCTCGQARKRRKNSKSPIIENKSSQFMFANEHSNGTNICSKLLLKPPSNDKQTVYNNNLFPAQLATNNFSPKPLVRMSVESQDSDEIMLQLEKLFHDDHNDDDLFEGTLCDTSDFVSLGDTNKTINCISEQKDNTITHKQDILIDNHTAQIKCLDEKLASLTGLLINNDNNVAQPPENQKIKKRNSSKWLCEGYFLKLRLFELLDQIGDCNRKKLSRIKQMLLDLFGADSDNEGVVSPLNETEEFKISCKERIAPWVVKLLTPYYVKGRIKGKPLFKALAKHLIRLIYQCSHYPQQNEVTSFVTDFLENHKLIRCEADFKEFRIENI